MGKLQLGKNTQRLLRKIADEQPAVWGEKLTPDEWQAVCTCMGLHLLTLGYLPPEVVRECRAMTAEVALRTGLPLHIVGPEGPQRDH